MINNIEKRTRELYASFTSVMGWARPGALWTGASRKVYSDLKKEGKRVALRSRSGVTIISKATLVRTRLPY